MTTPATNGRVVLPKNIVTAGRPPQPPSTETPSLITGFKPESYPAVVSAEIQLVLGYVDSVDGDGHAEASLTGGACCRPIPTICCSAADCCAGICEQQGLGSDGDSAGQGTEEQVSPDQCVPQTSLNS